MRLPVFLRKALVLATALLGAANCGSDSGSPVPDGATQGLDGGESDQRSVSLDGSPSNRGGVDGSVDTTASVIDGPAGTVDVNGTSAFDVGAGIDRLGPVADGGGRPGAFVDLGGGLVYDSINDVTWLADGLTFSKNIKATTADPANIPYTGPLIGTTVGAQTIAASDFTFLSTMGNRWFATWYGAVAWANSYAYTWSGTQITGWRLPTLTELDNLYGQTGGAWCGADGCADSPGSVSPFVWIPPKAWSATELQYVDFSGGDRHGTASATGFSNVWVVVSGNVATQNSVRVDGGAAVGDAAATALKVSVTAGAAAGSANLEVSLADTSDSIVAITVSVSPSGVLESTNGASATISGLAAKTRHTFSVTTTTSSGTILSARTNPLAFYDIVETFIEPECQYNTVFTGVFTFDPATSAVSNLHGLLTQAMYDGPPTVALTHQLSATAAVLGGIGGQLVTSFALPTTDTFLGGGFAPGGAVRTFGNENAYAMIFVNTVDPETAPTAAQIDGLAYADCTKNGLMGKTCMTGTTTTGYGRQGTMKGYPVSQVTILR